MIDLIHGSVVALELPEPPLAPSSFASLQPRLETAPGSTRGTSRFLTAEAIPNITRWTWLGEGRARPAHLPTRSALPISYVPLMLNGQADAAIGRDLTYPAANLSGLYEAFERESSVWQGQRPVRTGSAEALRIDSTVLDPETLIQYHPGDLPFSPVPLVAYRPDLSIDWVEGFSAHRQEPIWVPARHVFLGYDRDAPYLYETSSGVAVGGCLEEAMLHALLEVIERDAFLMTWYGRQTPSRLRAETLQHRPVQLLLDHLEQLGYAPRIYDVTQESGVPSVWVRADQVTVAGPASVSGAAAHFSLNRAVQAALVEVIGSVAMLGPTFDPARAAACWADPDQVTDADGHFQRFAHPGASVDLAFLDQGPQVDAREVSARAAARWPATDLTVSLKRLIDQLLRVHPDVVFVDLTTDHLRRHGLCCVRALVPGSLPITFGHRLRRVAGCSRLEQHSSLNPDDPSTPHPFP